MKQSTLLKSWTSKSSNSRKAKCASNSASAGSTGAPSNSSGTRGSKRKAGAYFAHKYAPFWKNKKSKQETESNSSCAGSKSIEMDSKEIEVIVLDEGSGDKCEQSVADEEILAACEQIGGFCEPKEVSTAAANSETHKTGEAEPQPISCEDQFGNAQGIVSNSCLICCKK